MDLEDEIWLMNSRNGLDRQILDFFILDLEQASLPQTLLDRLEVILPKINPIIPLKPISLQNEIASLNPQLFYRIII